MRRIAFLVVATMALLRAGACSCDQPAKPDGKPAGSDCTAAADCTGNLVCNPDTNTCDDVSCTTHTECGTGAVCTDGDCVDNSAGGPCDVDVNCVGGEQCRGDTCQPQGSEGSDCTTTEECVLPLVCNPADGKCAATVGCTGNGDCGNAAFCNAGTCNPASTQTPCTSDANCSSGDRCLGVVCVPDGCQGEAFQAEPVTANMLIVLDRSGSMEENVGSDGPKIDVARNAIAELMVQRGNQIRFGLAPYPGIDPACDQGERCEAGYVAVDIGDNNGQAITDYVNATGTCNLGTPTAEQLVLLQGYTPLQDTTHSNFILLLTDGAANCLDPAPEVTTLLNQTPTVKTFVVGFGSGVDAQQLEDMANNGGVPRAGNPVYYQADDAASLQTIFDDISAQVLSCDYTLTGAGNDPDSLLVFFNGQPVPRDPSHVAGWDYDPTTAVMHFSGNACVALQSGSVTDLSIAFGCPVDGPDPDDAGPGPGDAGPGPDDAGPGPGDAGPGPDCGGNGAACNVDGDCCGGFICNTANNTCLFLGG